MPEREPLQIRSYRVCWDLERRIYRLEQWRLPVAWGIPVRGIVYFAAVFLVLLVAARLPLAGAVLGALPSPVRWALLPGGAAYLLTAVRVDGRPLHVALGSLYSHARSPRWVAAFRPCAPPGEQTRLDPMTVAPDHTGPVLRRGRIEGPCRLLLRYPGRGRVRRGGRLVITQTSREPMWRGKTVSLADGQELEVRS